jgi:transposase
MSRHDSELTDEQWKKIEPLLPKIKSSAAGGRRRVDDRRCFEGILWVLRSGARWKDLPRQYPSPSTCWRRLRDWEEQDVWLTSGGRSWENWMSRDARLGRNLRRRLLRPGKKRGHCVGKTKRGKGTKWMVVASGQGVPLGVQLASCVPARSDADRIDAGARLGPAAPRPATQKSPATDLRQGRRLRSAAQAAEEARHRPDLSSQSNRRKLPTQDGRKLRRYKRRWKIERSIAWVGNFRRLVVRYEHNIRMYQAFFHVACLLITLRQF